jgi:hypothetical protein
MLIELTAWIWTVLQDWKRQASPSFKQCERRTTTMKLAQIFILAVLPILPIALPVMAQTGASTHDTNGPNTPSTTGYGLNADGKVVSAPAPTAGQAAQPNQTTGLNGTGGNAQSGGAK